MQKFTFLAKDFDLRKESNSSVVLQGTQAQNMNDGTVDLEHGASYDDDDTGIDTLEFYPKE